MSNHRRHRPRTGEAAAVRGADRSAVVRGTDGPTAVRRAGVSVAVASALALTGAACSSDSGDDLPPPPPATRAELPEASPEPASSLDPEDAAAAEEILAALDSYVDGMVELSTEGVPGGTEETLDRIEEIHVSGEAFTDLAFKLLNGNYEAGHVTTGTVTWEAEVVDIDWEYSSEFRPDEVVPRSTVEVCFDESDWATVDKETGEVASPPRGRYMSTVTISWRDEDPDRPEREPRWQVSFREDRSEPC